MGFGHFRRGNGPEFDGVPEAMWTLHPDFHKGLAGEAAAAAIDWFDANYPSPRTVCMIEPENTASLKLAERFGFREFGRGEYKGSLNLLLERLR